ncbi:MAG TPA: winged helix-turn-helix transcriptional regulator [Jatrophihabitans sp.]|jgi:DNA-binding HxlR family transcriptional regulator|nr:winged helix-turn-helix transcriptional regulator [Jatrophihabitans sp.]
MNTKRTYQQYCGLAAALDAIGERWTLLLVRELLVRPRRYGELLNDLPGVGTNLLAERLKFLVDRGIVRRANVSDNGKRQTYELTEAGHALRPIVLSMARWGLQFGELSSEYEVRATWALLAVEAMIDPSPQPVDEQYEFRIDDEVFHIDIRDGIARTVAGSAEHPVVTVTTDAATFVRIGSREVSPLAATLTGKLTLDGAGDGEAVLRACALLGLETWAVARETA